MKNRILSAVAVGMICVAAQAKVELPAFFTDNMVVQQKSTLTVAGTAKPLSIVKLHTDWKNGKSEIKADRNGRFRMKVQTPEAGGPYTIIVDDGTANGRKVLQNVLSGEVWLCSGQSNMEFPVKAGWAQLMDADNVVATMRCPELRLLKIRNTTSVRPLENASVESGWVESSPASADFTAIGYLYGRMLQDSLNVPVGIIDAAWGGTPVEAWTPQEYLEGVPGMEFYHEILSSGKDSDALRDATMLKVYQEYDNPDKMEFPYDRGVIHTGNAWSRIPVPSFWEDHGLPGVDGIVVMQYELNLPTEAAGKPLQLHLGAVDDMDMTYFNGVYVGGENGHAHARNYKVDGSIVKSGRNVITVEVVDNEQGGGIWKSCHAIVDGKEYNLDGEWSCAVLFDTSMISTAFRLPNSQWYPSVLYHAMIEPLTLMPLAGVLWYQGCSNVGNDIQYEKCFKNMITGWRKTFDAPGMPFYFVQLAGYREPVVVQPDSQWALLRNAQTKALELSNTGMVTAVDLGNPVDIHPTNKQEVARRLGMLALDKTYGHHQPCEAPKCVNVKLEKGIMNLSFDGDIYADSGVVTGFIIEGENGIWAYANAVLTDSRIVRLSSPLIANPTSARYNWADYPDGNLKGVESGLPVVPFATDK